MVIKDKNIVLGVTGGIAAYKALELTRLMKKEGANVWPVMTAAATEFVTPLSFETLACHKAYTGMFGGGGGPMPHIELAEKADLVVIAPATANIIGKASSGIADDLLSTLIMATRAPVLFAPAMNANMYESAAVKDNIARLKKRGLLFVGPEEGELACGWEGRGRLSSVDYIMEAIKEALSPKDLKGEKVLVTAGATREAIDPVRFISNSSSGKMGYALARAAKRRGAEVVLISGPSYLKEPPGVTMARVESASEMLEAATMYYTQSTIVLMAAAVSDFKPTKSHPKKVKKGEGVPTMELERTPDILKEMGRKKRGQFLLGFALETEDLVKNATAKLKDKNLDVVVANGPTGLNKETNEVIIIDRSGKAEKLPTMSKDEVAEKVLDKVVALKEE